MFEDLNWKWAARRAAVVIALYLGLLYVLNIVSPETFGLQNRGQIISVLVNAAFFFIIFTFVYAFVERSRRRRLAEMQKKNKHAKPAGGDSEEPGTLKGRPNPNTSRKKARRRR